MYPLAVTLPPSSWSTVWNTTLTTGCSCGFSGETNFTLFARSSTSYCPSLTHSSTPMA